MFRAAVPKATVNKQHQPFSAKHKIWPAKKFLVSPPARNSICPQNRNQFEFRILVSFGFNRGHNLRPFPFGKHIRHLVEVERAGGFEDAAQFDEARGHHGEIGHHVVAA